MPRVMVPTGSSGAIGEPESSSAGSLTAPSSCVTLLSAKGAMRSREDHERLEPLFAAPFAFLVSCVAEPFSSKAALVLACSSSVRKDRLSFVSRTAHYCQKAFRRLFRCYSHLLLGFLAFLVGIRRFDLLRPFCSDRILLLRFQILDLHCHLCFHGKRHVPLCTRSPICLNEIHDRALPFPFRWRLAEWYHCLQWFSLFASKTYSGFPLASVYAKVLSIAIMNPPFERFSNL